MSLNFTVIQYIEKQSIIMPVLDRERRATAGRRITELGGQDAEDDAAFWGHDTWNEDDSSSGNESFHSSDEDSEVKQDVFDSDFDESESDRDEEDAAAGDEEDKLIARGDKKRKESGYSDVVGKQQQQQQQQQLATRGKRIKGVKRVIGHGLNAGIVLNAPGAATSARPIASLVTSSAAAVTNDSFRTASPSKSVFKGTVASTRLRRADKLPKSSTRSRTTRTDATSATTLSATQPLVALSSASAPSSKKKKLHRHTQEELLLEAAHETEGENVRWLLARKRYQEEQKDNEGRMLEGRGRGSAGKLIMQYTSRRGYLNTITFPEMDHVPEILTRREVASYPVQTLCVISGLKARYRDPRTKLGYFDAAAFKELRRRSDAGEPIDQRKAEAQATVKKTKTNSISADANTDSKTAGSAPKKVSASKKVDLKTENGHADNETKVGKSQPVLQSDATHALEAASQPNATQAPEPCASKTTAGPAVAANLSRQSSPRQRKPSTKVLAARDAAVLTNGLHHHTPPPVTISPSRALQALADDSLSK